VRSMMSGVSRWSWPEDFPLLQFPNPPLIAALLASGGARLTHGQGHRALTAIFFAALTIWAYEEARHGENWFRRLLGLGFGLYILISLTNAIHRS
jgi:hypothetical protein